MNRHILITTTALLFALLARPAVAAEPAVGECARSCLYAIVDQYFSALEKHDVSGIPASRHVKFTENGVRMNVGDGLWYTFSGRRGYNLRVADAARGQVAVIEVIEEHGIPALLAARFRVTNGQIVEIETVLSRKLDNSPFPVTEGLTTPNPLWSTPVDAALRQPRERVISIADGYFNTLQQNNGKLFTEFSEDCNRIENGLLTTNNPDASDNDIASMGCTEQFMSGHYVYEDRLRNRRYPLVDEEMGVVLAAGFMDHTGKVVDFEWTDGTPQKSPFLYPHSYFYLELFKIEGNAIRQVESVFASMPYNMPSVW